METFAYCACELKFMLNVRDHWKWLERFNTGACPGLHLKELRIWIFSCQAEKMSYELKLLSRFLSLLSYVESVDFSSASPQLVEIALREGFTIPVAPKKFVLQAQLDPLKPVPLENVMTVIVGATKINPGKSCVDLLSLHYSQDLSGLDLILEVGSLHTIPRVNTLVKAL